MYSVNYHAFAVELQTLPLWATCADLWHAIVISHACDITAKAALMNGLRQLPCGEEWLQGLQVVCAVLRRENPRFVPATFMEWALEGK